MMSLLAGTQISRDEAAETVVAALSRPDAAFKSFELRRSEAADAKGKNMSDRLFDRLFLKLASGRWRAVSLTILCWAYAENIIRTLSRQLGLVPGEK